MKKPLIIITGPTASGKTALSVELAKKVGGEIISADSMQVYRHMDIGSAKVTKEEMDGVRHHLIDVLDPWDEFNVVVFQRLAKQAMEEIYAAGHIPIIAGGTGFYIQALVNDIDFTENDSDTGYREELECLAAEKGASCLHDMLKEADPESAEAIHANNVKRVIRALEFYKTTGRKISEHNNEQRAKESPYNFCYFVLNDKREILYDRINRRVDIMFDNGLLDEVKHLLDMGLVKDDVAMQGIGYKEVFDYLEGRCDEAGLREMIKQDTRHFAKRQLTWFRREPSVTWVDFSQIRREDALSYMLEQLKEKEII